VGSFISGKVTDWLGPKKALMQALLLWAVTMTIACFSFSEAVFWAVGPLAGISLGSTWVASRALVARLSPPRKFGEIYGLYNLGGKFGFVLGPLVWGGIILAFEPLGVVRYRIAIFSLLVFILVAMYVLKKVQINEIREVAPDAGTTA
jgi:UMF1 family MFS transporter